MQRRLRFYSPENLQVRRRSETHARFIKNDGLSLAAVPDGLFGFVFSFDSLVHVEAEVMESYISQILMKLAPFGAAFLHHSNMAALPETTKNIHNRAISVSGQVVADMVDRFGGSILIQEQINWGSNDLNDCFTLFKRAEYSATEKGAQIQEL